MVKGRMAVMIKYILDVSISYPGATSSVKTNYHVAFPTTHAAASFKPLILNPASSS